MAPDWQSPSTAAPMTDNDRTTLLHLLDVRHDELLAQLDALTARIDEALIAAGYAPAVQAPCKSRSEAAHRSAEPSAPIKMARFADRPQQAEALRDA